MVEPFFYCLWVEQSPAVMKVNNTSVGYSVYVVPGATLRFFLFNNMFYISLYDVILAL